MFFPCLPSTFDCPPGLVRRTKTAMRMIRKIPSAKTMMMMKTGRMKEDPRDARRSTALHGVLTISHNSLFANQN